METLFNTHVYVHFSKAGACIIDKMFYVGVSIHNVCDIYFNFLTCHF